MNLLFSDYINIAQTLILLLTGVVIVWYTIETARIRKATSIQNTLLAEQLKTMQTAIQHDIDKEASFIKPFFKFTGGMRSSDIANVNFVNQGGPAKRLSAKALAAFQVTVNPTRYLDTNENGSLKLRIAVSPTQSKFPFEIICQDKLSNPHRFKYFYDYNQGNVFEDEAA